MQWSFLRKKLILPPHRESDMKIILVQDPKLPFGPIYSLSNLELQTLKRYLDENIAKGFIEPSTSPTSSPVLFVKKKDGTLRLCVDYRALNSITIKDRGPLPRIENLFNQLNNAKYFTKLDLRNGYNLIQIAPCHEWKTAFRTRYGLFQYKVMPSGLSNCPAVFQRFMNSTFHDMLDVFVIVYIDDILAYSKTYNEHIHHVNLVLKRL